jgi:hypothetical protein
MVDGAGRSGFEAENGGVIELQETTVQVTCDIPRPRPRARLNELTLAHALMTREVQDCEQHCIAAGHGARVGCHGCRSDTRHLHAAPAFHAARRPRSFHKFGYSAVACSRASEVQVCCNGFSGMEL